MKYYFLTSFLLFAIIHDALPQDLSKVYGKVTDYELKMSSYSRDAKAGAVVLYDRGLSRFVEARESTFEVIFERSTKIKILKESGLSYATFSIPYYHEGRSEERRGREECR